jgi:hypothetical protein
MKRLLRMLRRLWAAKKTEGTAQTHSRLETACARAAVIHEETAGSREPGEVHSEIKTYKFGSGIIRKRSRRRRG